MFDEVQNEFRKWKPSQQDLTWKTNYLDLKIEANMPNDYREYVDPCLESAVKGEVEWRRLEFGEGSEILQERLR